MPWSLCLSKNFLFFRYHSLLLKIMILIWHGHWFWIILWNGSVKIKSSSTSHLYWYFMVAGLFFLLFLMVLLSRLFLSFLPYFDLFIAYIFNFVYFLILYLQETAGNSEREDDARLYFFFKLGFVLVSGTLKEIQRTIHTLYFPHICISLLNEMFPYYIFFFSYFLNLVVNFIFANCLL